MDLTDISEGNSHYAGIHTFFSSLAEANVKHHHHDDASQSLLQGCSENIYRRHDDDASRHGGLSGIQ